MVRIEKGKLIIEIKEPAPLETLSVYKAAFLSLLVNVKRDSADEELICHISRFAEFLGHMELNDNQYFRIQLACKADKELNDAFVG